MATIKKVQYTTIDLSKEETEALFELIGNTSKTNMMKFISSTQAELLFALYATYGEQGLDKE